jgi:hypothetical protein
MPTRTPAKSTLLIAIAMVLALVAGSAPGVVAKGVRKANHLPAVP